MQNPGKILLTLIVVALVITAGYFIFYKKNASQTGIELNNTSDWQTYRNEEFGFEAKHPNTWIIRTGTDNTTGKIVSVSLDQPYQEGDVKVPSASVQFMIQYDANPSGLSIDEWYADKLKKVKSAEPMPITKATIGGKPAILRESFSEVFGSRKEFLISTNAAAILTISYHPEPAFNQIYETIISSVKLIN